GVVGHLVPAVLLLTTLAGLLLLLFGPAWGRLRGLVLVTVPWGLLGPALTSFWEDPRLLLGGPGAPFPPDSGQPWHLGLLHVGGPVPHWLWWTAPLLLLAVLAVLRTGQRGRRAGLLAAAALIGLAAALAAQHVVAGRVPSGFGE